MLNSKVRFFNDMNSNSNNNENDIESNPKVYSTAFSHNASSNRGPNNANSGTIDMNSEHVCAKFNATTDGIRG